LTANYTSYIVLNQLSLCEMN